MNNGDKEKIRISLIVRVIIIFAVALVLSSIVVLLTSRMFLSKSVVMESSELARTALMCAEEIIRTNIPDYNFEMSDEMQKELHRSFRTICIRTRLRYLYLYTIDDDEVIHYLVCAADEDSDDRRMNEEYGYGSINKRPLYESERRALEGETDGRSEYVSNSFGSVYMWLQPVLDRDGKVIAFLGADYSEERLRQISRVHLLVFGTTTILAMLLSLAISSFLLRRSAIIPIKQLSEQMSLFAKNKQLISIKRKTIFDDEITDIERSFTDMVESISRYTRNIEELTKEKVQTQTQMEIARNVQCGVVPERKHFSQNAVTVCGASVPAKEVGGDFYDVFELEDDRVCVLIGDVSGKGITAALFMMMVNSAIREKIRSGRGVGEALNEVNIDVCASNPECMFATVFAGIFDFRDGKFTYANAGHNPPILLKKEPVELDVDSGIAIGMFDDITIEENEVSLGKGEGILIYTDGYTESVNAESEQFGTERLIKAVGECRSDEGYESVDKLLSDIDVAIKDFTGDLEQFDDMTILALLYEEEKTMLFETSLLPEISSFATVKEKILENYEDRDKAKEAILACEEMFTNIVDYSGTDRVDFSLYSKNGFIYATFRDRGAEFDPTARDGIQVEFEDMDSGGMGIVLAKSNCMEMSYERAGSENVLTLKLRN